MTTATQKTTTALEQFYQELLKDPMLQEQLKSAINPENLCDLAVELGKEKGYSFTKEEVFAAMAIEVAVGEEGIVGLSDDDEGEGMPITYTLSGCY
ncbi:MAG: Nif11-like leader peptide family natural product precursor [Cyanobacteria bacterium CRU_2_1]|nr:Nif11-like leader peptide family natural product precursor [Cyanobacteria bacterium CRU_2_1]